MPTLSRIPEPLYRLLASAPYGVAQGSEYYPCRMTLTDGRVVDRVYLFKIGKHPHRAATPDRRDALGFAWNGWEAGRDPYVSLKDIASLAPSPFSLPWDLVRKITGGAARQEREYRCMLVLKDGGRVPYIAPGLVDFPDLPAGVAIADVVDVAPYDYKTPQSRIRSVAPFASSHFHGYWEDWLRDPELHDRLRVTPALAADLARLASGESGRKPCRLTMKDGRVCDHALVFPAEDDLFGEFLKYEPMRGVARIEESPDRLPEAVARKITASGPAGKAETIPFTLVFRDGRRLTYELWNFIGVLPLPEGYAADQIADVIPVAENQRNPLRGPEVTYCPYVTD